MAKKLSNNIITVYMLENLLNGKIYIGLTTNLNKRYNDHRRTSNDPNGKKRKIHKAIEEFGLENFKLHILHECEDIKSGGLLEYQEVVNRRSNIDEFGYNDILPNKNANHSRKKITRPENIGKTGAASLVSKRVKNITDNIIYVSLRECALKEYGDIKYIKQLSKVCHPTYNRFTYKNKIYRFIDENDNIIEKLVKPIPVSRVKFKIINDITGKIYDSIEEASKDLGIATSSIRDRLYGRLKYDQFEDTIQLRILDKDDNF